MDGEGKRRWGRARGEVLVLPAFLPLDVDIHIFHLSSSLLFFFFSCSAGRPSLDDDIWRWSLICDTLGCWFVLTVSLQRRGKNPALHVSKSLGGGPRKRLFFISSALRCNHRAIALIRVRETGK